MTKRKNTQADETEKAGRVSFYMSAEDKRYLKSIAPTKPGGGKNLSAANHECIEAHRRNSGDRAAQKEQAK